MFQKILKKIFVSKNSFFTCPKYRNCQILGFFHAFATPPI